MKTVMKYKIAVDICMTAGMLASMAYMLISEEAHEWIGAGMFLLFIVHNILNRKWYRVILKGRYTAVRVLQTVINLLTLLCMLCLMISGIMLSRFVFLFLPINGGVAFARTLHLLAAYWGFVLMSFHLGLHWGTILGVIKRAVNLKKIPKVMKRSMQGVAALVAGYGVYAFIKHDMVSYMFLSKRFVFFDFERPLLLFFVDYMAIMGLWIWVSYYLKLFLSKLTQRRMKERMRRKDFN